MYIHIYYVYVGVVNTHLAILLFVDLCAYPKKIPKYNKFFIFSFFIFELT